MFKRAILATSLCIAMPLLAAGGEVPLPEFYGVYVISGGDLVELNRNSYDPSRSGITFGGADLIRSLSSKGFEDGDIELLFYSASAPHVAGDAVLEIARVAKAVTQQSWTTRDVRSGEGKDLNMWHLTGRGHDLRFAPVPNGDARMMRGVLRTPLAPGVYGVVVDGELFDFKVGPNPEQSAPCLVRVTHFTGAEYQRCPEGVGEWGDTPSIKEEGPKGKAAFSETVRYVNPDDKEEYLELHPDGRFAWQQRTCTVKRSGGTQMPCGDEASYRWRFLGLWWGDYEITGDRLTCVVKFKSSNPANGHTWVARIQGDRIVDSSGTVWEKQ